MPNGAVNNWTIRQVALERLSTCSGRPFLSQCGNEFETYGSFIGSAAKLANAFKAMGITTEGAVAILCPESGPHLHAWMACALLGATEVPINPTLRGEPLQHILRTAQPTVAIVSVELLPHLLEAASAITSLRGLVVVGSPLAPAASGHHDAVGYDHVMATGTSEIPEMSVATANIGSIMFTSGTTGPAKGAMMPNGQLCMMARQVIDVMRITHDDVFYGAHPLNHIAGKYMGVLATFMAGGRIVLDDGFKAESWLAAIRRYDATISIAHGPMIEMIFGEPSTPLDAKHNLRRLMCCPMPAHLADAFEARFDLKTVDMWGMTEIGCPTWTSLDAPRVPRSCGRVLTDYYDLQIVDPDTDATCPTNQAGEIVVRPRHPSTIMQGYLGMPDETVRAWRNLWFHTGDLGYLDENGNMFFVDRLKERIRRRSENISAYDIETAALGFAHIREAAAVGVPSEFTNDDDIKLCVSCEKSFAPVDLIAFLTTKLPHFMIPRYIEIMEALPRTPTNKVRKRALSESGVGPDTWDRNRANVRLRDFYKD